MPAVTSRPEIRPLLKCEPPPPLTASAAVLPRQQRPAGQLSLGLWAAPAPPAGEPTATFDHDRFVTVLTALVEVYDGSRPISQVREALHPSVCQEFISRGRRAGNRFTLKSAHARHPMDGVIEACGLIHSGQRALAMCTRFERGEHGWLCTEFTVMESGPSNPRTR